MKSNDQVRENYNRKLRLSFLKIFISPFEIVKVVDSFLFKVICFGTCLSKIVLFLCGNT